MNKQVNKWVNRQARQSGYRRSETGKSEAYMVSFIYCRVPCGHRHCLLSAAAAALSLSQSLSLPLPLLVLLDVPSPNLLFLLVSLNIAENSPDSTSPAVQLVIALLL